GRSSVCCWRCVCAFFCFFFFQAEDGIRDFHVTGVQTCALPISWDAIPTLTHFRHMGEFWKWAQDHDGHSLFRHLETYQGAVEALWRLTKRRHAIVIVTTKPTWAIHDTFEWIAEHRLPTREVHITDRKWDVDCDVYLEDAPHNLEALVRHRPDRVVARYVRPWNEPVPGAVDVADWNEF